MCCSVEKGYPVELQYSPDVKVSYSKPFELLKDLSYWSYSHLS
jgi:hypothetical protein